MLTGNKIMVRGSERITGKKIGSAQGSLSLPPGYPLLIQAASDINIMG